MNENDKKNGLHKDGGESPVVTAFWSGMGALIRRWRLIVAIVGFSAAASVIITLLIPNEYTSTARVLPPEGGSIGSMLGNLGRGLPGAASLLTVGRNEYSRYLAILSSRSTLDTVIDEFDLKEVYQVTKKRFPQDAARRKLDDNIELEVDRQYRYMAIQVTDRDPGRAAEIANFLVAELNSRNAALAAQDASLFRSFVHARLKENEAALDSVKNAIMAFQQQFGLLDIEEQSKAFWEQAGKLRAIAIELDIQHQTLLEQYGPEHPQVRVAQNAYRAAQRSYEQAIGGAERALPVAQTDMPLVIRQYMDLEQERIIQSNILEIVAPLYEQARLDEEREVQALQIIDHAIPPERKSAPKRTIICIIVLLSTFVLACAYVLLAYWWDARGRAFGRRVSYAVMDAPRKVE